jgi:uncharacterized protein (TIGR02145 family)
MKKLLTLAFILLATTQFAFAQQAIAKIKYEEAEEAYATNKFELTVTKLNEVEAILKSTNPRVMYLKIMAQNAIINNNPYKDFEILKNIRYLSAKYLKDYENVPNNEDKYRDIYKISEALNANYPKTLDEFNKIVKKEQEKTLTICSQVWLKKNLDVSSYSDGTQIPQVTDPKIWADLKTGAWCNYNNDPSYETVYGKLYNWYAVAGIYDAASLVNSALRKKLSPDGFHIPTDSEWARLFECLGGSELAGGKIKEINTLHWLSPNKGATNDSGFKGLPGGRRNAYDGTFSSIGYTSNWWSLTEESSSTAWYSNISNYGSDASHGFDSDNSGLSVRCVKN